MIIKRIYNKLNKIKSSVLYGLPPCKYPVVWKISPTDRLLLLSPHPDDECIACGGLLLKHGGKCDIVLLTDGRHGDDGMEPAQTAVVRKKEFENIIRELKVNSYRCLEIEDLHLIENFNLFKDIDVTDYNYILMPAPHDNHPDHRAVSMLFNKLVKLRKMTQIKVVYYEVWSALPAPTHYIDISDTAERKRELINMYQSQVQHIDYASRILGLNHYRGMLHNIAYEEDFIII
jgi:LmbE family N-acetylglucosaminyl deacetylase